MNALPADISFVTTPQELFEAVRDGAQDIVITSHLDLTGLPLRNSTQCTGCQAMLGDVHPWTRSIRVRLIPECHSRVSSLHINSHLAQAPTLHKQTYPHPSHSLLLPSFICTSSTWKAAHDLSLVAAVLCHRVACMDVLCCSVCLAAVPQLLVVVAGRA